MEKNAMNLNQRNRSTKTAEAATAEPIQRKRSTKTATPAKQLVREQALSSSPGAAAAASGNGSAAFSPAERIEMIAIAAYQRAGRRGVSGGSPEQDWLEAEAEIDQALGRQSK